MDLPSLPYRVVLLMQSCNTYLQDAGTNASSQSGLLELQLISHFFPCRMRIKLVNLFDYTYGILQEEEHGRLRPADPLGDPWPCACSWACP